MVKKDYVLLNYTGHRIIIKNVPDKHLPVRGGELMLPPLGRPKINIKVDKKPEDLFPYELISVSGIGKPMGCMVYIVMPEIAYALCGVRKDLMVPVNMKISEEDVEPIKPGIKTLTCDSIAKVYIEYI